MKKFVKIIKIILLVIITVLILITTIHQILTIIEKKNNPTIGQYVNVDGKDMNLYILGEGKNTIVLLPGLGTASPVLDFLPLAQGLAKENRVVIVEPFGYGWSDITSKERTIENEVKEIHSALHTAEIDAPYILMPHSISGIHSVYYANTYPDEVAGIIGIDCTLPRMAEYFDEELPKHTLLATGQLVNLGVMRLITLFAPDTFISDNSNNYYTDENLSLQRHIASWKAQNKNVIDQMNHISDSIAKTHDMTFGKDLPVLFFTTDDSNQKPRDDGKTSVSFYETYITNPSLQKVISLNGPHYLHWTCKDEMCSAVQQYISEHFQ
ncbi:alpha/beta fold hydrolase [Roseburia sp. 499]|uniref:alpha/beta fold hydrolase n=1 Tax=Roseburia sp. 499 TaxID=1261634 RepID=UPI000950EDF9|nr:alpha/beta hydrolase [Roseburia sp. 499]WVK71172.1 alpha/beta hydrolase [Roseburia sp. 499]